MKLKACPCCGTIQELPHCERPFRIQCCRCQSEIKQSADFDGMRSRVASLAISALVLLPAALLLPIVEVEKLGHFHRSSVVDGIRELIRQGEWGIGLVIFAFSIVLPLAKLLAILELTWICKLPTRHRAITYRWVETIGKWGMLDVLLLALMVMWIKIGSLVEFHFGPAIFAFALSVGLSLTASLLFDPHAIWSAE